MLPRSHPDRIQIAFDDHRLVANAGLMLPTTLARRLGLPQLADRCLDLGHAGAGQHRRQADDPGGLGPGRGRLHRRRRRVAQRWDRRRPGLRGQGPVHPGHLPAQLPVGPRPPTGPGEPGVAGPGLVCRGRSRRRTIHHRPGLHHLRDLPTNQRYHAAIGAPGGAYVVRSPASDMGTSW